jgi:hypothetical protein
MRPRVLIVDEMGYLPFGREEANQFFNIVAPRGRFQSDERRPYGATVPSRCGILPSSSSSIALYLE